MSFKGKQLQNLAANDYPKRAARFQEEFRLLLSKHRIGLRAEAFLMPDGRIGTRMSIVDADKIEKKDPNQSQPQTADSAPEKALSEG